jgi:DNA-binding response OmpR family regulator
VGVAKRILVAEDDPVTRRFVVSLLEERGYEVLVAEDGEHAVATATAAEPDLIVSDLVMPYRDGYEVLRAIRSDDRLKRTPVLILSMRDREEDIVRGFEQGADEYVVKPFNARELVARVRKLLEPRGA